MATQIVILALAVGAATSYPAAEYPGALYSQYHAQDELGQYNFGYSGPTATKHEQKTLDGVTRGGYSYVDPHGRLQTRSYTADDVNGFRVAGSDLPVGPTQQDALPAYRARSSTTRWSIVDGHMQEAPHQMSIGLSQHAKPATIRNGVEGVNYDASSALYSTPALAYPVAAPSPYSVQAPFAQQFTPHGISAQYHAQDELGQYTYGYSNNLATKSESKTADGITRGSYSYVDPNGMIQSRSYVADDGGFRVVASDLPQVNY